VIDTAAARVVEYVETVEMVEAVRLNAQPVDVFSGWVSPPVALPEQLPLIPENRPRGWLTTLRVDEVVENGERAPQNLVDSIRAFGVFQPIAAVVESTGSQFAVVDGRRRVAACRELGIALIPALVFPSNTPSQVAVAMALVGNVVRATNPVSEFRAIHALMMDGHTEQEIARELRIRPSVIRSRLQLASLLTGLLSEIESGRLSLTLAYEIAREPNEVQQRLLSELTNSTAEEVPRLTAGNLSMARVPEPWQMTIGGQVIGWDLAASTPSAQITGFDLTAQLRVPEILERDFQGTAEVIRWGGVEFQSELRVQARVDVAVERALADIYPVRIIEARPSDMFVREIEWNGYRYLERGVALHEVHDLALTPPRVMEAEDIRAPILAAVAPEDESWESTLAALQRIITVLPVEPGGDSDEVGGMVELLIQRTRDRIARDSTPMPVLRPRTPRAATVVGRAPGLTPARLTVPAPGLPAALSSGFTDVLSRAMAVEAQDAQAAANPVAVPARRPRARRTP